MGIRNFYERICGSAPANALKWGYQTLLALSGVIILLAMVAMVLLRYVLKINLFGMDEIILCFVFWFYFFGAVNGSREDSQVRADVTAVFLKNPRTQWALRLFTRAIEIVVTVFLIGMSFWLLAINFERMPATQGLKIPYLVPQFAIAVGFVLMLIYNIGHFLKALAYGPDGEPAEETKD